MALGGTDEWRDLSAWPPAAVPVPWYPHPDGGLAREPPPGTTQLGNGALRPGESDAVIGGSGLTQKSGIRDNTAVEQRDDVLVFTSTPLTAAIEVIGTVAAEILVDPGIGSSSATLFVRLCDLDERDRSWNVCDGITQVVSTDSSSRPTSRHRRDVLNSPPLPPRPPNTDPDQRRRPPPLRRRTRGLPPRNPSRFRNRPARSLTSPDSDGGSCGGSGTTNIRNAIIRASAGASRWSACPYFHCSSLYSRRNPDNSSARLVELASRCCCR